MIEAKDLCVFLEVFCLLLCSRVLRSMVFVQYGTVQYGTCAVWYLRSMVFAQYGTAQYGTVQYGAV
jgi:hypothetical protein